MSSESASGWIDISVLLRNEMVHWPSDPPFHLERIHDMERGDTSNLSRVAMGAHAGTHVDAPLHFIRGGASIDKMPLSTTIGPVRVIEINDHESIKPEELKLHRIRREERILFKTRNSSRVWKIDSFVEDFVFISNEGAQFLAQKGVVLIGVDYLSVGGFRHDGHETHLALLEAGIWIIEGLDLSQVAPGKYDLICLPLKIDRGEGAPARAVMRPISAARGLRK